MASRSQPSTLCRTVASSLGRQQSSRQSSSSRTFAFPSTPSPSLTSTSPFVDSRTLPPLPPTLASSASLPPPPTARNIPFSSPPSLPSPLESSPPFASTSFPSPSFHISRAPQRPPPLRNQPRKSKVDPSQVASSSTSLFEEETNEYRDAECSLPVVATQWKAGEAWSFQDLDSWQDPRTLPCATLASAVRQKNFSDARRQLVLLHERGAGALESPIYVAAAINSLVTPDLETDKERLEWFIHWYSLVPAFEGEERAYLTSLFRQQNARLCELLLQFESQIEHLNRILVLFGEKRYAAFFAERLLPHIAQFGPPERAFDVLEAVALASGWSTSNADRNILAVTLIETLASSGHLHEAVAALARVRTTYSLVHEVKQGVRLSRPAIPQSLYLVLYQLIGPYWGWEHEYAVALRQWKSEDYPGSPQLYKELPARLQVQPTRHQAPSPKSLPQAIRSLLRPGFYRPSATALSFVLQGIYTLFPPRYGLIGLLHRRMSGITQISKETVGREDLWIRAEMLRLLRARDCEGALRLYASRYLWVGLPTGLRWEVWRKLQTKSQEDVGLGEDVVGDALTGIRRKQVPPAGIIPLALSAIVDMDLESEDPSLLEEDYVSFLNNSGSRHPSAVSWDSTPRLALPGITSPSASLRHEPAPAPLDISELSSTLSRLADGASSHPLGPSSPTSLVESSASETNLADPSPPSSPVPITPWSSPPSPFNLPPPLLPTRSNFSVFVRAFSLHNPGQAMGILRDMVDRKIHTDSIDWSLVLEGFVRNRHPELAVSGLQTLEKEGGIATHNKAQDSRVDNTSLLGPIQPLGPGEENRVEDEKPQPWILGRRPRQKAVPPATSEVYVRLIRAAQRVEETEISLLFEEMMRNAGVVLTEYEKWEMQQIYLRRGKLKSQSDLARSATVELEQDEWEQSPWGEPVYGLEYGLEKGWGERAPDGGVMPNLDWERRGWARTELDEGTPVESRLKRMLPNEGRRMQAERERRKWVELAVRSRVEAAGERRRIGA